MDKSQDERPYGDRQDLYVGLLGVAARNKLDVLAAVTGVPLKALREAVKTGPANLTDEQVRILEMMR